MKTLLQLKDLRKTVAGRLLLDIRDFSIPEAACTILSGRNGAGKTTLLRIIAGLEPVDTAEVIYQGQSLPWKIARRRFRHEIVYLHQQPYMFDHSVADNVAYGLLRSGLHKRDVNARVRQALAWAGLTHLAQRNARELSGGEKQRVALTRARVLAPRLLLLDEPVANMDLESREQTIGLIKRLKDEGISSIVTTHEPQLATRIGDQHRHLCKTGPCRYTIVRPFLYEQPGMQDDDHISEPDGTEQVSTDSLRRQDTSEQHAAGEANPALTAVILAGGRAQRMGGDDKGLLPLNGRPMIEYIIDAVQPQVGTLLINANRNLERYAEYGFPVIPDMLGNYYGPLVGMASAMQAAKTDYVLTLPCDSPVIPKNLAEKLFASLQQAHADISVAHDGERMQPVFALLRCELLPSMLAYLQSGGRKIDTWYAQHKLVSADFSAQPEIFVNVNTPEQRQQLERELRHMQQSTDS